MARILIVATSDIHLQTFHLPFLELLKQRGHQVEIAAENRKGAAFEDVSQSHDIAFPRNLLNRRNFSSLKRLRAIIRAGHFDIVHCHTPIPSALTRLAVRPLKASRPITIYTAHGFHFYPGARLIKFVFYFLAEKLLSRWTDAIICINKVDFFYSKRYFQAHETFLIPGVGVSDSRFLPQTQDARTEKRRNLRCRPSDFVLSYVAEFIPRKNHRFLLNAIARMRQNIKSLKVLLIGTGPLKSDMEALSTQLNLDDTISFLGFRKDVENIVSAVDLGVSTSRHEGLGLGIAEHMLCGVPVVASLDRGHIELIDHGENGYLYKQNDYSDFCHYVETLARDADLRYRFGTAARRKAKHFTTERSLASMSDIFDAVLEDRS